MKGFSSSCSDVTLLIPTYPLDLSVSAATLELSVLWTGSNPLLQTLQAPSPVFHTYLQCYNVIDYWNDTSLPQEQEDP